MQLLSAPIHPPGCCCVCRTTPKGPYLDLGQFVDRERLYLCPACTAEAKRVLGVEVADDDEPGAALEMAEDALEDALEAVREADSDDTSDNVCPGCGREFANRMGVVAHQRYCKGDGA